MNPHDSDHRTAPDRLEDLPAALSTVARIGQDAVQGERSRIAVQKAVTEALVLAGAVATLLLVASWIFGAPRPVVILGCAAGAAILWIPLRAILASLGSVPTAESLMVVDRSAHLRERMTTAAGFLNVPVDQRTPFMNAAIEDARHHVPVALASHPKIESDPWVPNRSLAFLASWVVLAVGLAFLTGSLSDRPKDEPESRADATPAERENPAPNLTDPAKPPPPPQPRETPVAPLTNLPPRDAATAATADQGQPATEDVKESKGKTGAGRSANAASASGKGDARGVPSAQGQSTENAPDRAPKKNTKPKPRKEREEAPSTRREEEQKSGSTTGRGAASGSNKSPASSEWSSKDQVTSDDEKDLEDDEEVDDEFDDQDSRGGVQPQLRDRKPPVNRDLGISFGNTADPDANGRGGPSEPKKSRGVATLVLGVPLPDHIKGRPNPGKTKITQERVQPQPEDLATIAGENHPPRTRSQGSIARPEMDPWMVRMISGWFASTRETDPRKDDDTRD